MCNVQTVDSMMRVPACVCYSRSYAVLRALLHLHTYLCICLSFWPVDPMAWALLCVDQQRWDMAVTCILREPTQLSLLCHSLKNPVQEHCLAAQGPWSRALLATLLPHAR